MTCLSIVWWIWVLGLALFTSGIKPAVSEIAPLTNLEISNMIESYFVAYSATADLLFQVYPRFDLFLTSFHLFLIAVF